MNELKYHSFTHYKTLYNKMNIEKENVEVKKEKYIR
jgi:hypothetical protein